MLQNQLDYQIRDVPKHDIQSEIWYNVHLMQE